jgi:hypothetical protein
MDYNNKLFIAAVGVLSVVGLFLVVKKSPLITDVDDSKTN